MIISTKIAEMFKSPGFVNVGYLARNKINAPPSSILNILRRKWVRPLWMSLANPNFGNENIEINPAGARWLIRGSWFVCPSDGTADSITVYLDTLYGNANVKCAIYNYGLGAAEPGTLVAATEERLIAKGTMRWETFNFSGSPPLSGGVKYFLVVWSNNLAVAYYEPDVDNKGFVTSQFYNGFPSPPRPLATDPSNHLYSIFCTYTTVAPPAEYVLTLASDKTDYYVDEKIILSGFLTLDGAPLAGSIVTLYRNGAPHLETATLGDGGYSFEDPAAFEGAVTYYTEHVEAELIFRSPSILFGSGKRILK